MREYSIALALGLLLLATSAVCDNEVHQRIEQTAHGNYLESSTLTQSATVDDNRDVVQYNGENFIDDSSVLIQHYDCIRAAIDGDNNYVEQFVYQNVSFNKLYDGSTLVQLAYQNATITGNGSDIYQHTNQYAVNNTLCDGSYLGQESTNLAGIWGDNNSIIQNVNQIASGNVLRGESRLEQRAENYADIWGNDNSINQSISQELTNDMLDNSTITEIMTNIAKVTNHLTCRVGAEDEAYFIDTVDCDGLM